MIQHLLFVYSLNLKRAQTLVQDLSEEQMVAQPHGVINHPAWTLGHLAATSNSLAQALGLDSTFPEAWKEACKTGGTPSGAGADFPSKEQLLDQLSAQHERVAAVLATADVELLAKEHPSPPARQRFPTVGDYAVLLMASHEGSHLGQLAAWRRAMGLGSASGS